MAGHRYWRLRCIGLTDNNTNVVATLQFRATVGGGALMGTPIGSAPWNNRQDMVAAWAFDDDPSTRFFSVQAGAWLGLDFGPGVAPVVAEYAVGAGWYNMETPRNFVIEWSDDGTVWAMLAEHALDVWGYMQTRVFASPAIAEPPSPHRHWRLVGILTDLNILELSQAQLYDGATLIAQAPTFTVPPTTGTAFPEALRWDDCTMPGFAVVWDLATPVGSPTLRLGAGASAATFPKELYCQYSDDGQTWSTSNAPVNIEYPGAGLMTADDGTFIKLSEAHENVRWRHQSSPGRSFGGALLLPGAATCGPREYTYRDVYHGGRGVIRSTVKRKNTPADTPLRRRVDLIDERSRLTIRTTWSDAVTGNYEFRGVREDLVYSVVAWDHLHAYRAEMADNLTLANGVELMP